MTEPEHSAANPLPIERRQRSRDAMRAHIGALIAHGTPLPVIARQHGLPNLATLRRWLAENADLRQAYEEARELREEYSAEDAVMLADALADANNTGLRLRLDARKWGVSLNRKDGKKTEKNAAAKETLERLQRALERVKRDEDEQMKQLRAIARADVEAEYAERRMAGDDGDDE